MKEQRWVWPVDCQEGMSKLEDNSVSMILSDPPYFMDGMGDDWDRLKLDRKKRKSRVVVSMPAGMKFSPEQGTRLLKFMKPIAREWIRVIRPGGFALVFSQNRLSPHMAIAMESQGFEIRDILVWKHDGGQAKAFSQDHFVVRRSIPEQDKERLVAKLAGRKTPQLRPQCEMIIMGQAPREGTFVDNWDRWETGLINIDPHLTCSPGTVIECKKAVKDKHITPKPVDLLQHLIRLFSIKGALVFDPFAGSGSTGVAARLEGRDFLGMEIDVEMASFANRRIANFDRQENMILGL